MNSGPEYFNEQQQFPSWLQAILLGGIAFAVLGAVYAIEASPEARSVFFIVLPWALVALVLVRTFTLTTRVMDEGVNLRGMWFVNRLIKYSDIQSAEIRVYKPIVEYGGWGYRLGLSGKAYNMRGNEGVQLLLNGGGRVLIGSQRAAELAAVISARIGKKV
jgi:hypothetical protein